MHMKYLQRFIINVLQIREIQSMNDFFAQFLQSFFCELVINDFKID